MSVEIKTMDLSFCSDAALNVVNPEAKDYIINRLKNSFKLNKDIFIQYGNGQVYLFKILSNFFEINLFTIGVFSQFLFSLKFIIFFFILRFFVDNLFSTIGVIIYYLLYTFTQTI